MGLAVYDDRLEVTSTGSLHFGLTPDELFGPHESRPWNPLIARTFYRRGIIEEWGRGTLKMAELATSAGLPRPEIEDAGGAVTVCFRHGQFVPSRRIGSDVIERQEAILALLDQAEDGLALREIHARLPLRTSRTSGKKGCGGVEGSWASSVHGTRSSGAVETRPRPVGRYLTPGGSNRGQVGV